MGHHQERVAKWDFNFGHHELLGIGGGEHGLRNLCLCLEAVL
jgi:hypothetical protein